MFEKLLILIETSSDGHAAMLIAQLRKFSSLIFNFLFSCGLGDRPQCYFNLVSSRQGGLLNWVSNQETLLLNILQCTGHVFLMTCGASGKQKKYGRGNPAF
jgi:hypothetical protein